MSRAKRFGLIVMPLLLVTASAGAQVGGQYDLANLRAQNADLTLAYDRIDIQGAWDEIINSDVPLSPVIIGVVDFGMSATHQEFSMPPVNLGSGDRDLLIDFEPDGHGTQVAGIIGASNVSRTIPLPSGSPQMNGILSGVLQENQYALEFKSIGISPRPTINPSMNAFEAINSAITNGASVINLSFGDSLCSELPFVSFDRLRGRCIKTEQEFFDKKDATAQLLGTIGVDTLIVVAAGNDGINATNTVPASIELPNVMTVAATGLNDERANFPFPGLTSNFGEGVDISAPGLEVYAPRPGNSYVDEFLGTSAAAPFVTGVAGLLKALNPSLSPADIKDILISPANTDPVTTDPDKPIGRRLNAHKAVCDSRTNLVCGQFTPWLSSSAYQQVFNQQLSQNRYPRKVEGRLFNGTSEFRGLFVPFPPAPFSFWSHHGITQSFFIQRDAQLTAQGYERIWDQSFFDAFGIERFQATWTVGGSAFSSFNAQDAPPAPEIGGTTGGGTTGGGW